MTRPHPWEALYPPGLDWGAALPSGTIPALLDHAVAQFGPRPAIEFRGRRMTFDELALRVDQLAATLTQHGVSAGTAVALLLPNTPAHPVAFFAVLRLGGIVVHLSPLDPARTLLRKIEDAGATLLITTDLPGVSKQSDALAVPRLVLPDAAWDTPPPPGRPALPPVTIDPHSPAVLQFTGGTTGLPRAAVLTHANLTSAVAIYDRWAVGTGRGYVATDRLMCVLPLFHIYALTAVLLRAIANGVELMLRPRFDPAVALDDIEAGCTHFNGVPTMWIAILNHPGADRRDFRSLKLVSSGGAALPPEIAARFRMLTGLRVGGGWGMTETSPAGTNLLPDRDQAPGEIGVPLPGIEMQIVSLDDPARVLPPDEVGEVRIRGPNVTPGYWNRPAENAAAFVDGWFLTGDIGRMAPDGVFTLVDRKKDMIISGGFNVYPRAIEDAIHEHPDIREAAVIGVADPYRGQAAKAFVSLRDGAPPLTLDELKAFLADKLGRHEMPAALEIRDQLPHTPVGKLAKRDLMEPPP